MNKLCLLAIAAMLAVSGCGSIGRPSGDKPQAPAQGPAPSAAAGAAGDGAPAEAATAPGAGKPAEAAQRSAAGQPEAAAPAGDAERPAAKPAAAEATAAGKPGAQPPAASVPSAAPAQPTAAEPAEQPQPTAPSAAVPDKTALTISITGDKKRGVILKEMSVPFQEGSTVMDVLKQVTKDNKLQMEYQGKGAYAYVQGIDNLYEFDGGPKSGWVYKVNGRVSGEGAGAYKLAAGDKIEWLYTLNLGADVGAAKR